MQNTIIDEHTGWEYELKGDYYYPTGRAMRNGVLSPEETPTDDGPEEERPIGIWGQRHLRFIRQHRKSLYLDLYMTGKLNGYIADINAQADELFFSAGKGTRRKRERDGTAESRRPNGMGEKNELDPGTGD